MTILTDEQQALTRLIGITGLSTHGTSFAGGVGINLDGHTPSKDDLLTLYLKDRGFRKSVTNTKKEHPLVTAPVACYTFPKEYNFFSHCSYIPLGEDVSNPLMNCFDSKEQMSGDKC
jgi:hypothetical protein